MASKFPEINTSLNPHPRSFYLPRMVINTEACPHLAEVQRIRHHRLFRPKGNVYTSPSIPKVRNYCRREGVEGLEPEIVDDNKETLSLEHNRKESTYKSREFVTAYIKLMQAMLNQIA